MPSDGFLKSIPVAADRPVAAAAERMAPALDAIMDRYARGDDRAFDDLYRAGAPRVRGFLLRLCGDAAVADDLTQETFVRVHRARSAFEKSSAALPWFFSIARNAFLDHKRRGYARRRVSAALQRSDGELPEAEAPLDGQGDQVVAASEMLDLVRATLDTLTPIHREAFVLVRFEGLSIAEAARVVGATEAAVKVRAFRAYEALRQALDRQSGEDA
jgi:RNA polymerase sigma-70 factor (ECF subfamily)